jgi:hypothetical protein
MTFVSLRHLFDSHEGAAEATIVAALQAGLRKTGTATIVSGQTSIAVTHGLGYTPDAEDIHVTPIESLGSASFFFVDTITSTQFTINVNVNPAADVDFVWRADLTQ